MITSLREESNEARIQILHLMLNLKPSKVCEFWVVYVRLKNETAGSKFSDVEDHILVRDAFLDSKYN
jgi:hypothetical protein